MSVINQMLRDLDARDASEQERAGLPPRLRTLPPVQVGKGGAWRLVLLGMVLGGVVVGLLVSWLMRPDAAPVPASMPAPGSAVAPAPTNSPPVPAPSAAKPPVDTGEMKLSTLLATAQDTALPARVPKEAAVVADKPLEKAGVGGAPKPVPSPKEAASRSSLSSADAQIDKRPQGGQGKALAEDEYRKGMQAVKRGDVAAAEPIFRHALELDPAMAKARQALLSVLVGGRRWNEAQQVAHEGLAIDPAQTGWATILARLQFEQGNVTAAVNTLQQHAAYAGSDAEYQGLFAYLLQNQQRPAEAADRFKIALGLRPNEGRWWFGLGLALEGSGKAAEAREAFGKAREIGNLPNDMQALLEQKLK
jgi:MSHA biogenesis protein MshN